MTIYNATTIATMLINCTVYQTRRLINYLKGLGYSPKSVINGNQQKKVVSIALFLTLGKSKVLVLQQLKLSGSQV